MKTVCALERKKNKLLGGCENDVCLEPSSCRNACSSCLPAGCLLTVFRFIKSSLSQFKPARMPKGCPYFSHCGLYSSTASLPLAPETCDTCKDKPRVKKRLVLDHTVFTCAFLYSSCSSRLFICFSRARLDPFQI